MMKVEKRDGRIVNFNKRMIRRAITKAFIEQYTHLTPEKELLINKITDEVQKEVVERTTEPVKIYEIQNIVEHFLIENNEPNVAILYKDYRLNKDIERKKLSDTNRSLKKLAARDKTIINENANKDSRVFSTLRDLTAGTAAKSIGLDLLPKDVANAHLKGEIHYHDLDYHPYAPMTNCCLINFKDMFENGFVIGNAEVCSPNSINTATAQMAQIVANVGSNQYGGCSANRADEILAPYALKNLYKNLQKVFSIYEDVVEEKFSSENFEQLYNLLKDNKDLITKDVVSLSTNSFTVEVLVKLSNKAVDLTLKDIFDACQGLEYEINTIYSSAGQTPFFSFNFGLGTSWVEKAIQKSILQVRINGLGIEHRTAIFPKLIYTLKRGVNLEENDPNYDVKQLAIECASKRMYPDILSYDKIIENTGSFKSPMGCRSFLSAYQNEDGEQITDGRMNLGVVTLNLPRIAIESEGDLDNFWNILDERLNVVHHALQFRIKRCKEANPTNAPILFENGAFWKRLNKTDKVDELFKHAATISIGYIGLYEVGTLFFGSDWEDNEEAKTFTLNILKKLSSTAKEWSLEEGYHYSVYGTPSESLTDRFCHIDKNKFGSIENITDKDYYTNSFHYDIRKKPSPFDKIDFEQPYEPFTPGGFIHYVEFPNLRQNPKALEAVWDYAYDRIGYFGTNTPIDHCFVCGFDGDFDATEDGYSCPECGNKDPEKADVVKRLCGYLGNPLLRPSAHGRQVEIASRQKHMD